MKMGVVADDVTGANDIGGLFARAGLLTHIYPFAEGEPLALVGEPDIVILDTNARLDSREGAYAKVMAATRALQRAGCRQFFSKTSSAFVGPVGAYFDAMLDACGESFAVVVVGLPQNGRLTRDGLHYVHGRLLAESEFRHDPIHPMTRSNLVEILQSQTRRAVGLVGHTVVARGPEAVRAQLAALRTSHQYAIVDVVDEAAVTIIAQAVHDCPVLCGSSALAGALPEAWGMTRERPVRLDLPAHSRLGLLCVAGSLMPQTAAQIQHVQQRGALTQQLDARQLFDDEARAVLIEALAEKSAAALQAGHDLVLHSPNEPALVAETRALGAARGLSHTETARLVSRTLAEVAGRVLARIGHNRLVVAGGETSAAVCARLGVRGLRVWQEIQPGLPSCVSLPSAGAEPLWLVLKSGSFGSVDFLELAFRHLRSQ